MTSPLSSTHVPCALAPTTRVWSYEQLAFFNAVATTSSNIILLASAGSGKTTTAIEAATREACRGKRVKFLAFNKNIDEELGLRLPKGIDHSTFHSAGLAALSASTGGSPFSSKKSRPKIDGQKVRYILKDQLKSSAFALYASPVAKLVSYAKSAGIGTELLSDTYNNWHDLVSHFDLQMEEGIEVERVIRYAMAALTESNARRDVLDFDDMLYLPLLLGVAFPSYDLLFIDEAQDTNAVQRALLRRMLNYENTTSSNQAVDFYSRKESSSRSLLGTSESRVPEQISSSSGSRIQSRLVAVGDPNQAIYGFRGADADAMTRMKEEFDMTELPLSVSYRCSKAVVREAMKWESGGLIKAHDTAPEGEVAPRDHYDKELFQPTSAGLCRNTTPLIAFAFALIERGIGVHVLGRDIGQGLVSTIRACKATSLDELEMTLIRRRNSEAKTCRRNGNEQDASAVEDKYDCLNVFVQQAKQKLHAGIQWIEETITQLFDEKRRGLLTLSTIHKAKGLEWPTVFLLDAATLMPSKWATLPWQKRQEKNLRYVATTRTMENLYFITSNRWRKEGEKKCEQNSESSTMPSAPSVAIGPSTEASATTATTARSAPPPTFNPDAVDVFNIPKFEPCDDASEQTPSPQLSSDTASDDWINSHIYDSERKTSNPDAQ